nr:vegetative cell wall protein gp1-like [Aegilops tauschii subsp. strangulata]
MPARPRCRLASLLQARPAHPTVPASPRARMPRHRPRLAPPSLRPPRPACPRLAALAPTALPASPRPALPAPASARAAGLPLPRLASRSRPACSRRARPP